MKRFATFAGFFFLLEICYVVETSSTGGFIFTAPKIFWVEKDQNVCFNLNDTSRVKVVEVIIQEQESENILTSIKQEIRNDDNGTKCVKVRLPRTRARKGHLQLALHLQQTTEEDYKTHSGLQEEDYTVNYIKPILIEPDPDVTFIQTDKPFYRGGETVRLRAFTVRSDLTPVLEPVNKIWIENPSGVRVAQWLNEPALHGFVDKTFQLATDAYIGTWNIKFQRYVVEITQSFSVADYVLPRFSVTIQAPKWTYTDSDVEVTACAKYTFGQPVQGKVIFHLSIECAFSYYCKSNQTSIKETFKLSPKGCFSHKLRLVDLSSFSHTLLVNATVVEEGTGVKSKASSSVELRRAPTSTYTPAPQVKIITRTKKYKSTLPFRGQVNVAYPNQADHNEQLFLCLETESLQTCKGPLIANGTYDFVIPGVIDAQFNRIVISVKRLLKNEERLSMSSLSPWFSPSQTHIQIINEPDKVSACNTTRTFQIEYSASKPLLDKELHYMIMSRGDIVSHGVANYHEVFPPEAVQNDDIIILNLADNKVDTTRKFEFSVEIPQQVSPSFRLIVYYVREDGEIIADSVNLSVGVNCFQNQVKLKWNRKVGRPGSKKRLEVHSSPNSVCALSVSDVSTKIASGSDKIDEAAVFNAIEKFTVNDMSQQHSDRCSHEDQSSTTPSEIQPLYAGPETDSDFVDSLQAFQDFGVMVITDFVLETRPCREKKRTEEGLLPDITLTSRKAGGVELENMSESRATIYSSSSHAKEELIRKIRSVFPETWIWELLPISQPGRKDLEVTLPHTITSWDADAICLSDKDGLGIADTATLTTFQPFFLDFDLPESVKRKEILYLQVSVFNYADQNMPVKVTYIPSKNFRSISEEAHTYCIDSKSKEVHRFVLEAVELGEANITVIAEVDSLYPHQCGGDIILDASDAVVKKTKVKYEGFPVEEIQSGFICGDSDNFEDIIDWDLKLPDDLVESSVTIVAMVSGDILGPALQNTEKLISLPTGCGEQNMIQLVPNLLLLDYLLLTKATEDPELVTKALKNLDIGYQRQLNYRHQDGSYSAFGEQDRKGSIWLTAFVVRYFSQAQKFIHVDQEALQSSVKWITKHQLENGCFPLVGKVYHRDFKGKMVQEESSKTLTAYILISLIESGMPKSSSVIKNAIYCLKGNDESLGLYGDLLTTYSLLLAGEVRDAQSMMKLLLRESTRTYQKLWWESRESPAVESSIEMTSYGIMSLVKLGGSQFMAAASDAIRWLTQYRNHNGGFLSTQDTILALEAISKFSATLPRIEDTDVLVVGTGIFNDEYMLNITKDNRLVQQTVDLPPFLPEARFRVTGKGCVLVQTLMRYNVRRGTPGDNLKMQLKIDGVSLLDLHTIQKFHICVRYKSAKEKINMAVLEVPMVTGFYPDRSSLYDIPISRKGVRRWEEFEDKVNFYFEDLGSKKVCLQFLVKQEVCVENAAPALIKLYDYYDSRHLSTMRYNLQPSCNTSDTWLDISTTSIPEVKQESKRESSADDYWNFQPSRNSGDMVDQFVDVGYDLEVPQGNNGVMPVYALPPQASQGRRCPQCSNTVPEIFPQFYCSSQAVVVALIRSKEIFEFYLDLTPRRNITALQKTVLFTIKDECTCDVLNSVNSYALILVTPPRSIQVQILQELHLDDSITIYPLEKGDQLPEYISEAIHFCQQWYSG